MARTKKNRENLSVILEQTAKAARERLKDSVNGWNDGVRHVHKVVYSADDKELPNMPDVTPLIDGGGFGSYLERKHNQLEESRNHLNEVYADIRNINQLQNVIRGYAGTLSIIRKILNWNSNLLKNTENDFAVKYASENSSQSDQYIAKESAQASLDEDYKDTEEQSDTPVSEESSAAEDAPVSNQTKDEEGWTIHETLSDRDTYKGNGSQEDRSESSTLDDRVKDVSEPENAGGRFGFIRGIPQKIKESAPYVLTAAAAALLTGVAVSYLGRGDNPVETSNSSTSVRELSVGRSTAMADLSNENKVLRLDATELQDRLGEIEDAYKVLKTERDALVAGNDVYSANATELQDRLGEIEDAYKVLKTERDALVADNNAYSANATVAAERVAQLQDGMDQLLAERDALVADNNAYSANATVAAERVAQLQDGMDQLLAEHSILLDQHNKLVDEHNSLSAVATAMAERDDNGTPIAIDVYTPTSTPPQMDDSRVCIDSALSDGVVNYSGALTKVIFSLDPKQLESVFNLENSDLAHGTPIARDDVMETDSYNVDTLLGALGTVGDKDVRGTYRVGEAGVGTFTLEIGEKDYNLLNVDRDDLKELTNDAFKVAKEKFTNDVCAELDSKHSDNVEHIVGDESQHPLYDHFDRALADGVANYSGALTKQIFTIRDDKHVESVFNVTDSDIARGPSTKRGENIENPAYTANDLLAELEKVGDKDVRGTYRVGEAGVGTFTLKIGEKDYNLLNVDRDDLKELTNDVVKDVKKGVEGVTADLIYGGLD